MIKYIKKTVYLIQLEMSILSILFDYQADFGRYYDIVEVLVVKESA